MRTPVKEDDHATRQGRDFFAPSQSAAGQTIGLSRLWEAIPSEDREQMLRTLSRIVAQQIPAPPRGGKEVDHEDC